MAGGGREVAIDLEFLRGRQNETVVKELCVVKSNAAETFRFKNKELHNLLTEAVAGFAHLYAHGL